MLGRCGRLFVTLLPVFSRVALFGMCCALALAGCTKPEEGSDPPPLASASPSPSPSPTKSATPVDDKAAILALAKDYFLERNRAIRSGDTKRVRALAIPDCPCNGFIDQVDADWRKGRVDSPSFYTIIDVVSPHFRGPNTGFVTVLYRTNRYAVLDEAGGVVSESRGNPQTRSASVELRRIEGVWKVADVVRL